MKKSITYISIAFCFLLSLCSCEKKKSDYFFVNNNDGLIYNSQTQQVFSGKIIDSTDLFIINMEVKNGEKNGRYVLYTKDGIPLMIGNITNNLNSGKWEYFYPSGILESDGHFINDKANGVWRFYYPNGNLREKGEFNEGLRTGLWMFYDTTGRVDSIFKLDP